MRIVAFGLAGHVGKEIVRVERRTSTVPAASKEAVSARLRDDAHDGAAVITVLGGEAVVLELEFLDRFHGGEVGHVRGASLTALGALAKPPSSRNSAVALRCPFDTKLVPPRGEFTLPPVNSVTPGARNDRDARLRSCNGMSMMYRLVNLGAKGAAYGVHLGRFAGHLDGIGERSQLQLEFQARWTVIRFSAARPSPPGRVPTTARRAGSAWAGS